MNIVYSFIGDLPEYAVDTVYQLRLFYNGPVYFIVSNIESKYAKELYNTYNVTLIPYNNVKSDTFDKIYSEIQHKFVILPNLIGRERLFVCSFERFYILYELMTQYQLNNVLYLELDNLVYNDPKEWLDMFLMKDICYMFDNYNRASSGICFIKNNSILFELLKTFTNYMLHSNDFMSEMMALYDFFEKNPDSIQILPTHWEKSDIPNITYNNYKYYKDSIFDAAAIGIYLGGMDPFHTNNQVQLGLKSRWSLIDYTGYKYEWKTDEKERCIPYIYNTEQNKWLRINNLHIHSKELSRCFSKDKDVDNIITGEKLQNLCDVFCGKDTDLNFNPMISKQKNKHKDIKIIHSSWDNPRIIFCYNRSLTYLKENLSYFQNPFILVSHNNDTNITEEFLEIAEHPLVIKWFSQNIMVSHSKLELLPIGIANKMWTHGDIEKLVNVSELKSFKMDKCYFYFNCSTNHQERDSCKQILESKGLEFGKHQSYHEYLVELSKHKFAISPPGNGIDCHRIWECYYLGVIPIVLKSPFTELLSKKLPVIILNSWDEYNLDLYLEQYEDLYKMLQSNKRYIQFDYYRNMILQYK
jgi:hypothetical protein